jgi:hypothetical protein
VLEIFPSLQYGSYDVSRYFYAVSAFDLIVFFISRPIIAHTSSHDRVLPNHDNNSTTPTMPSFLKLSISSLLTIGIHSLVDLASLFPSLIDIGDDIFVCSDSSLQLKVCTQLGEFLSHRLVARLHCEPCWPDLVI